MFSLTSHIIFDLQHSTQHLTQDTNWPIVKIWSFLNYQIGKISEQYSASLDQILDPLSTGKHKKSLPVSIFFQFSKITCSFSSEYEGYVMIDNGSSLTSGISK